MSASSTRKQDAYAGSLCIICPWLHRPCGITSLEAPSKCEKGPSLNVYTVAPRLNARHASQRCALTVPGLSLKLNFKAQTWYSIYLVYILVNCTV